MASAALVIKPICYISPLCNQKIVADKLMLELGMNFVFSDRHAYLNSANFYNNINELNKMDWPRLQARDFKRDPEDPEKFEKYQAEVLIHQHVPVDALLGVICYSEPIMNGIVDLIKNRAAQLTVHAMPGWYL